MLRMLLARKAIRKLMRLPKSYYFIRINTYLRVGSYLTEYASRIVSHETPEQLNV